MGAENVAPASLENAIFTRASFPAAVNHATATSRPRAATAGPFVGQPPIFQPSRCTGTGAVHVPFTRRTIEMSRISPAS